MKKTISGFIDKFENQNLAMNLYNKSNNESLEILNDQALDTVRGGDKDYSPAYESAPIGKKQKWFETSVLLNV